MKLRPTSLIAPLAAALLTTVTVVQAAGSDDVAARHGSLSGSFNSSVGPHGEHHFDGAGSHFSHGRFGHGTGIPLDGPESIDNVNSLRFGVFGTESGSFIRHEPSNQIQYGQSYNFHFSGDRYQRSDKRGWMLLEAKRPEAAVKFFARQAQDNPGQGFIVAGYGLSAAINGDKDSGLWAMRKALRTDPFSLPAVELDATATTMARELGDRYIAELNANKAGSSTAFMLAAVSYLHRDYHVAWQAWARAHELGDRSDSMRNLRKLLLVAEQREAASVALQQ